MTDDDLRRDANTLQELAGLQNIVNSHREFQRRWLRDYEALCGPFPRRRLTRRQRLAEEIHYRIWRVRNRVALWVAPWLDYD